MPWRAASAIVLGVLRQQLVTRRRAVRRAGDDVGEGAAAIDPELPAPLIDPLSSTACQVAYSPATSPRPIAQPPAAAADVSRETNA